MRSSIFALLIVTGCVSSRPHYSNLTDVVVETVIEAGVAAMRNPGVTLNSAFLRPRSRGTVRLASADPAGAPLINPNYWSDPYDRECALKGLELARDILRQPALKPFVLAERLPGDGIRSKEDLIQYAYRSCKTDHHPVGTCAMAASPMAL